MRGANPINSNAAPISVFATILLFVASLSYAEERGPPDAPFTLAIAGDMIGPFHPMHRLGDPQFAKVAKLFRNADAGFANQEGSIFDLRRFVGYPAAETGGGYVVQQPSIARDIRDMGISLVSKANNHATDWGTEGLVETLDNLNRAGLVFGGAGLSDSAARQPVYLDTRKGLVALVATALSGVMGIPASAWPVDGPSPGDGPVDGPAPGDGGAVVVDNRPPGFLALVCGFLRGASIWTGGSLP